MITTSPTQTNSSAASLAVPATRLFSSDYGWGLSLPSGWHVLPKLPGESEFGLACVEVFSHPHDPSLSLTWMRSNREISDSYMLKFRQASSALGLISAAHAHEIISEFFPLMGRAVTAFSVELPGGQVALEISEEIVALGSSSEPMRGYHLLLPASSGDNKPLQMQQLVFYARMSKFAQEIYSVIQTARSFKYL